MRQDRRAVLLAAVALAPPRLARAAWRDRPVRLVHNFGPGGNPDTVGRIMAGRLAEHLPQPVVVEPRPDHPAGSMAEMLAMARAWPRQMFWGSGGERATTQGLSGEMINVLAGTEIQHVPHQSTGAAQVDLMAGRVDFLLEMPMTLLGAVQAGRKRALATTGEARWLVLPEVPTLQEVGVLCAGILAEPETIARLAALGSDASPSTPGQFRDRVAADVARWTEVVTRAGIERRQTSTGGASA